MTARFAPYPERYGPVEAALAADIREHEARCREALARVDEALARFAGRSLVEVRRG